MIESLFLFFQGMLNRLVYLLNIILALEQYLLYCIVYHSPSYNRFGSHAKILVQLARDKCNIFC